MGTITKKVLAIDLAIQSILVGAMLFFYVVGLVTEGVWVFALLVQLVVGIVQVSSGFIHTIVNQDKTRGKYTAFALAYVTSLILGVNLIGDWAFISFFVIFVILIPVAIAVWYTNLTYQNWQKAPNIDNTIVRKSHKGDEDILDDVEWL